MPKRPLLAIPFLAMTCAAFAQDETWRKELQSLRQRVDELEEQQAKTAEQFGGRAVVQPYTAKSFEFGGHVSSLFSYMRGEADSEAGHIVTLLELYLRAQIDDHWSMYATPGFYTFNNGHLDNPQTNPTTTNIIGDPSFAGADASDGGIFLSRAYGEWKHGDTLQIQGGIVGTPHGTTNRVYHIPARAIAEGSLHTRYFLANTLYPQHLEGLRGSGKLATDGGSLEYDAYFGVEDDSPDDSIGGARLAYVFDACGLSVAANYGRGTRQGSATPTINVPFLQAPFAGAFNTTRDYQFGGVDIEWNNGDLSGKTEAYYSAERDVRDQRAFSTEWSWFVSPQWAATYRFDYYDAGADLNLFALAVVPLGHATEHVLGVSFNPNGSVRLRVDLHHLLLPNTDDTIDFVNFSWSISF